MHAQQHDAAAIGETIYSHEKQQEILDEIRRGNDAALDAVRKERDEAIRERDGLLRIRDGFRNEAAGWLAGIRAFGGDLGINTIDGRVVGKFPPVGGCPWTPLDRNSDDRDRMLALVGTIPRKDDELYIPLRSATKHGLLCEAAKLAGAVIAPEAAPYSCRAVLAWAADYHGWPVTVADVAEWADVGVRSHGRNRLSERDVHVIRYALRESGRFTSDDDWHFKLTSGGPHAALLSRNATTAAAWVRDCLDWVAEASAASSATDLRESYASYAAVPSAPRDLADRVRCESVAGNGRRYWRRSVSITGWAYARLRSAQSDTDSTDTGGA